jgi:AAA15 family ATPase/GTPase
MPNPQKLCFPRIKRVKLKNFSLYDESSIINEEVFDGVFCLAGANGLGKSTFLAALNFAITGMVPEPKNHLNLLMIFINIALTFVKGFLMAELKN